MAKIMMLLKKSHQTKMNATVMQTKHVSKKLILSMMS